MKLTSRHFSSLSRSRHASPTVMRRLAGTTALAVLLLFPAARMDVQEYAVPWHLLLVFPIAFLLWLALEWLLKPYAPRLRAYAFELRTRRVQVARVAGIPVFADWTLLAMGFVLLPGVVASALVRLSVVVAYVLLLLVHELGHAVFARLRHCTVHEIQLRGFHGITWFNEPADRQSQTLIAWGGVAAQALLGVPACLLLYLNRAAGLTPLNGVLAVLGPISALIALLNLLPLSGLDGEHAWNCLKKARAGPRGIIWGGRSW